MQRIFRFRDVLTMLKRMARDRRISDADLRAVLAGGNGKDYTQDDIARARELAALVKYHLTIEPDVNDAQAEAMMGELRRENVRLHGRVKFLQESIDRSRKFGNEKNARRIEQLISAGVVSIDEAFKLLAQLRGFDSARYDAELAVVRELAAIEQKVEAQTSSDTVSPSA